MTIYDKYNICKESDGAVFISKVTGSLFIFDNGPIMRVYSNRGVRVLADLGGIDFFTNLDYIGDL